MRQQSRDGVDLKKLNRLVHHRKHAIATLKKIFDLHLYFDRNKTMTSKQKKSLQKKINIIIGASSYSCCGI
jgi:hypothetical protein